MLKVDWDSFELEILARMVLGETAVWSPPPPPKFIFRSTFRNGQPFAVEVQVVARTAFIYDLCAWIQDDAGHGIGYLDLVTCNANFTSCSHAIPSNKIQLGVSLVRVFGTGATTNLPAIPPSTNFGNLPARLSSNLSPASLQSGIAIAMQMGVLGVLGNTGPIMPPIQQEIDWAESNKVPTIKCHCSKELDQRDIKGDKYLCWNCGAKHDIRSPSDTPTGRFRS